MTGNGPIAVLGAGAMGTALAVHVARNGGEVVLLATDLDGPVVQAWRERRPHPVLGVPFDGVPCRPVEDWAQVLGGARVALVAVSSAGLSTVLAAAARAGADPQAWVLATKGWQAGTLSRPSQVAAAVLGDAPVVSLSGPGLAAEIAAGDPTGLVCASRDRRARSLAAEVLAGPMTALFTTSDVEGTETASAFKNVVAIAVGIAEGLAGRFAAGTVVRNFANARAAVFARGMLDMRDLVRSQDGRTDTAFGLAGAGDLYVTCQHGRNGRFGRLLGGGAGVENALITIGSTVEGVSNTASALQLAARAGIDLPSARIVDVALQHGLTGDHAPENLRAVFTTALALAGRLGGAIDRPGAHSR